MHPALQEIPPDLPLRRSAVVDRLRQRILALENAAGAGRNEAVRLHSLGLAPIDAALRGGLRRDACHEIRPVGAPQAPAATGFALALAGSLAGAQGLTAWIGWEPATGESGALFAHGLVRFGLDPARLILVSVASVKEVLWAFEECLKCPTLGAVVAEVPARGPGAELVATRRLSLLAGRHGVTALVLRPSADVVPTAAATRWQVGAARSMSRGGVGPPAFSLSLSRNRAGPTGRWTVEWDPDAHVFRFPAKLSRDLASDAAVRPHSAVAATWDGRLRTSG